jgi:hypothetical protein
MTVSELVTAMNLRVFEPGNNMNRNLAGGYASDLLSDVMGYAKQDQVWITLQNHLNVIAIASLKDIAAVILVHGQEPAEGMLTRAREEGITLLGTESDTFITSSNVYMSLYQNGTSPR